MLAEGLPDDIVNTLKFSVIGGFGKKICCLAPEAWVLSKLGAVEEAKANYAECDSLYTEAKFNPELSVLRHNLGLANGETIPPAGTEYKIGAFYLPGRSFGQLNTDGLQFNLIDKNKIKQGITKTLDLFEPGIHKNNIYNNLPHVLFVSTGRCGTRSVQKLLQPSNVIPFHDYWWMLPLQTRWEQQCRLMNGDFDQIGGEEWCQTRAAEWLGSMFRGKQMVGLNHTDSIFAAIFAAVHSKSKIIYLHRDPVKIFRSFWQKAQWNDYQLRPLYYNFGPDFQWKRTSHNMVECIAWYIKFTNIFASALKDVLGDRVTEISADKLFCRNEEEIARMLDFIGSDIPVEKAIKHFSRKVNEKPDKVVRTDEETDNAVTYFHAAFSNIM